MDFTAIEKKISNLDYKCHGLLDSNKLWVLKPNPTKDPSKLPNILKMLKSLPPGLYEVNCSNGQGLRGAHYNFPIDTREAKTEFFENGNLSQAAAMNNLDATKLGRLESENDFLKQRLAELELQIEELNDLLDEEPEELAAAPPTLQQTLLENLAPVIPPLADKLLAIADSWIKSKTPQPIAEAPTITPDLADQIAEMVKAKIYAEVNQQPNNQADGF